MEENIQIEQHENLGTSVKEEMREEKVKRRFDTKKEPKKSLTNFQRNQFRTLFSSMALSDRKSMILVRINTTLISALIVFHRYIMDNLPMGTTILISAIVGVGLSLVLSLLSSKPIGIKSVLNKQILPNYPDLKNNVLLHFSNPSLEEYELAMDDVVRNQDLQIGNQVRTSYLINTMLLKQYRLLTLSYNAFILTFIVVIVIFLVGMMK